jgi:hypothetical protein
MDLRCAIALGLAGGFATTAAPALAATTTAKSPRGRLDPQAPSDPVSTPVQALPEMEQPDPSQARR